jgi:hypothetical protein
MNSTREESAVRKALGDVAPKLVDLTENVLFGDVTGGAARQNSCYGQAINRHLRLDTARCRPRGWPTRWS